MLHKPTTVEVLQLKSRERHAPKQGEEKPANAMEMERSDEWEDRMMAKILMADLKYGRRARVPKKKRKPKKEERTIDWEKVRLAARRA